MKMLPNSDDSQPPPASWPERRRRVTADCALIAENRDDAECAGRLREASGDQKWEVRKVVAEGLASFPEPLARELSAKLAADSNAMVRSAADRSISRRGPASTLSSSHPSVIQTELERIERKFGTEARQEAFRLAERAAFLHVRTAVHDIKNILTHFNLDLGALLKAAPDSPSKARVLRFENGRQYLIKLVGMMEAYSRDINLTWHAEDLVEIVQECVNAACDQVQNEGKDPSPVKCEVRGVPSIVHRVSRFHFAMVVTNLIKNAIQSHAVSEKALRKGQVAIEVASCSDAVRISIGDTGKGISPSDLQKLLDFVPGGSSKPGGMGYGLPICRRYIEAHGGALTIRSEEEKGTEVVITLPVQQEL
jgi:signal transduction histidine kinase